MFIQRDPIGLLGGLNTFQYAPNPIILIDPWGLYWNYYLKNKKGEIYYHGRGTGKVRGNVDPGISEKNKKRYIKAGKRYLKSIGVKNATELPTIDTMSFDDWDKNRRKNPCM